MAYPQNNSNVDQGRTPMYRFWCYGLLLVLSSVSQQRVYVYSDHNKSDNITDLDCTKTTSPKVYHKPVIN